MIVYCYFFTLEIDFTNDSLRFCVSYDYFLNITAVTYNIVTYIVNYLIHYLQRLIILKMMNCSFKNTLLYMLCNNFFRQNYINLKSYNFKTPQHIESTGHLGYNFILIDILMDILNLFEQLYMKIQTNISAVI